MCGYNSMSKVISLIYIIITIGLPILYLMVYASKVKNKKKKNYSKALSIAIIIFILFYSVKLIAKLTDESCFNCYINNTCIKEEKNMSSTTTTTKKEITETTTSTTTTSTTTSTTTVTTTKKTNSSNLKNEYGKVAEISGERKEVGTSDKGYTIYQINGVTYIDGYMIVNKTYTVSKDFVPTDTYASSKNRTNTCNDCINNTVWKAWKDMQSDAAALGLSIKITSGYRPYNTQNTIYNRYVNRDGKAKADTYSARPGSSEHQTALCFDLNSISDAFANTKEGKWVNENAYKYGFIIRYPKGKNDETGYKYESWHLRYVGTELATKLYNNGDWISMEKYFGITSKYSE